MPKINENKQPDGAHGAETAKGAAQESAQGVPGPSEAAQARADAEQNVTLVKRLTDSQFVREFKDFINRGSVVELAIGVAVGGAFTSIAKSLVDDIVMPIASLLLGGLDFSRLSIDIPNIFGAETTAHIAYGNFIQNVVNFLIIAFTVFVIVKFMNQMNAKSRDKNEEIEQAQRAENAAKADSKKAAEGTGAKK